MQSGEVGGFACRWLCEDDIQKRQAGILERPVRFYDRAREAAKTGVRQKKRSCLRSKSCARQEVDRIQGRAEVGDGKTEGEELLSESPSLTLLQRTWLAGEWSEHGLNEWHI